MSGMTNYDSPSPEVALGYFGPMFKRFIDQGYDIKSVLDVGAAHGHFSGYLTDFFPDAKITAVECNTRDSYFLAQYPSWDVHYACLGEKNCKMNFYIDPNAVTGGGNSNYKENTQCFKDPIIEEKQIVTMDEMFEGETFDLVKIDTQGSELDIIKGGKDVLSRSTWLLLELSYLQYNEGAPLIDDVLAYTRSIGWRMYDVVGPVDGGHMGVNSPYKLQADVLLKRCDADELKSPFL